MTAERPMTEDLVEIVALGAIEGARMKVVRRVSTQEILDAIALTLDRHPFHFINERVFEAAFDAAPAFGGGE